MMDRRDIDNEKARFLAKVKSEGFSKDECWFWQGAGKGNGYGHFKAKDGYIGAHRFSYQMFWGAIPTGMDVCHTCDNRSCVNPYHLFTGSRKENMADCVRKGRAAGGNRKHLKQEAVQEVMRRLNAGLPPRQISNDLDINYSTVIAIKKGDSYVGQCK